MSSEQKRDTGDITETPLDVSGFSQLHKELLVQANSVDNCVDTKGVDAKTKVDTLLQVCTDMLKAFSLPHDGLKAMHGKLLEYGANQARINQEAKNASATSGGKKRKRKKKAPKKGDNRRQIERDYALRDVLRGTTLLKALSRASPKVSLAHRITPFVENVGDAKVAVDDSDAAVEAARLLMWYVVHVAFSFMPRIDKVRGSQARKAAAIPVHIMFESNITMTELVEALIVATKDLIQKGLTELSQRRQHEMLVLFHTVLNGSQVNFEFKSTGDMLNKSTVICAQELKEAQDEVHRLTQENQALMRSAQQMYKLLQSKGYIQAGDMQALKPKDLQTMMAVIQGLPDHST